MNLSVNVSELQRPLWYQFPECAEGPYAFVFYYAVKVLNLVVGTPCNLLVMWHILSRRDSTTSDIFILHLALLDACFCLATPLDLVNRLLLASGRVWYVLRFTYGAKDAAPLFLVCVCLDRYMAVVHPVLFVRIGVHPRVCVVVCVWVCVFAYGVGTSVVGVVMVPQIIFSAIIVSSFVLMLICNSAIMWTLRRTVVGKEEMTAVKRRAYRTVLGVMAIIVANYLPPVVLTPFIKHYTFEQYNCRISLCMFALMDLSCSVEPLVYLLKTEAACCGRKAATTH